MSPHRFLRVPAPLRVSCMSLLLLSQAGCGGGDAPVEEPAEAAHDPVVTLTAEQVVAAGIDTAVVTRRTVPAIVEATAVIEGVPDLTAHLAPRVVSLVAEVLVNEGDHVTRGQRLAVLDSPELGRAKADFIGALAEEAVATEAAAREGRLHRERITSERVWREAEGAAARARAEREAAEGRLHALGLSDDDLEQLRSEQHYGSTFDLRTPLAGIVTKRRATVGETVDPAIPLFTVIDLSRVWVQVDVYDSQLPFVRTGQPVTARTGAYPERVFTGQVDNIGATVEPTTRAVKVRAQLRNPDRALKPGMFAEVVIEGLAADSLALAVPRDAWQRDGDESIVFVVRGTTRYERRVVETGLAWGPWVVIRSGLSEGDVVVTRGAFVLKAEYRRGELGEGAEH